MARVASFALLRQGANGRGGSGMVDLSPDWVTLRIFLATLDRGSIARASAQCGIANSAAAKRLQLLEEACGLRLLDRGPRGVRPTPAGETMARHARALIDLASRLRDDITAFATGGHGTVRLAATPSVICGHGLGEALAGFTIGQPGIRIDLREQSSVAILHNLAEGRIDLGLITGAGPVPAGFEGCFWHEDRLVAAAARAHPLAGRRSVRFAEVLDYPMVGMQAGGALALQLDDAAQQLGRRPDYRFQVESVEAGRKLVAAGLGIAVMPDAMLRPYEAVLGLGAVPLNEGWARRRLRLVARPADALAPPVRLLRDHLLSAQAVHASAAGGR
jgi:DNA-binding transcriptional LysR family regulator